MRVPPAVSVRLFLRAHGWCRKQNCLIAVEHFVSVNCTAKSKDGLCSPAFAQIFSEAPAMLVSVVKTGSYMTDRIEFSEKLSNKVDIPANQLRSVESWSNMKPGGLSDLQLAQSNQMRRQGFIDFSKTDDIWAKRHESQDKNFHRNIAGHIKDAFGHGMMEELKIPKHGDNPSLKQLMTEYKTPFIDVYRWSKNLPYGAPGRSPTLETLVDRLQLCPWADQIRGKFDGAKSHPDYDPAESAITINPNDTSLKQMQDFAHESYHATHQKIAELYSQKGPLRKSDYVASKTEIEGRCFESEVKVTNELRKPDSTIPSPTYSWANAQ